MNVPGSNLLSLALTVIGSTPVDYYQYQSVSTNAQGRDLTTYHPKQTIVSGSVQAVDRSRYERFGLDWEKRYISWFVPNLDAVDLSRNPDINGDVIEVNGRRFQLMGGTDWFDMDGWMSLLGVDIGPATGATTNA